MESPHDRYVASGQCPSVSSTKAWCNLEAGHHAPWHMAPYLHPDGKQTKTFWTNEDLTPRPA